MIRSSCFFSSLDCLAGQFFNTQSALCTGKDFGARIDSNVRKFFSLCITSENLPHDLLVLGILLKKSANKKENDGFIYMIFIDTSKINGELFKEISSIILAHQMCHFAFYYELFLTQYNKNGKQALNDFTRIVSGMEKTLEKPVVISQAIFDEHNKTDLIKLSSPYPMEHFTRGEKSYIYYNNFFIDFLDHLHSYVKTENSKSNNFFHTYKKSPEPLSVKESILNTEWKFYEDNRDKLVKKYCGKYIVISGNKVISAYDDEETAFQETVKTIPLGSFMIRHVAIEEEMNYLSPYING